MMLVDLIHCTLYKILDDVHGHVLIACLIVKQTKLGKSATGKMKVANFKLEERGERAEVFFLLKAPYPHSLLPF